MLKRIIPCLDVKNGRVVKGINFVNLVDAGDPSEQAKFYSENGADEICFLDITASNENRNTILDVVKKTSEQCFVPLTVGGGVRNLEDISNLLSSGADKVSINTAAVNNKNIVNEKLKYNSISEWDSIGHMTLISELEKQFNISIETDDVIDFSSYKKGIEILKKYKIDIK